MQPSPRWIASTSSNSYVSRGRLTIYLFFTVLQYAIWPPSVGFVCATRISGAIIILVSAGRRQNQSSDAE
ncbi:unnamed protein product [Linum trigynum]|uniref:Uncharacterized protein n=1 Tax=Linum trigynum TaxID=586398 RepID=A0AAV2FE19_9ROSI